MELRAEDEAGGSSGEDEDVDEEVGISDATERSDAEEIADNPSDDAEDSLGYLSEEESADDVEIADLAEQASVAEVLSTENPLYRILFAPFNKCLTSPKTFFVTQNE